MPTELALQMAGKVWSGKKTSNKIIDTELTLEFARIIDGITKESYLGNATNKEILDELSARIELNWDLEYKTTGSHD